MTAPRRTLLAAVLVLGSRATALVAEPPRRARTVRARAGFGAPPPKPPPSKKYDKKTLQKAHERFDEVKAGKGGLVMDVSRARRPSRAAAAATMRVSSDSAAAGAVDGPRDDVRGFSKRRYAGAPEGSKLFFVGKIGHDIKTPPDAALTALQHLLKPHACFLQPALNAYADKLVWAIARGNSEVEVAKGEEAATFVEPMPAKATHRPGFAPEWYEPGEEGFYIRRGA